MPIYSYKCMGCGKVTDRYMKMNERRKGVPCECGHLAVRSYTDELAVPQLFEPYFDIHLADEDYPEGRYCTGFAQKKKMMREMGFEYRDKGTPDPPSKREMWAQRNKIPLKRHFVGLNNKLKARNIHDNG